MALFFCIDVGTVRVGCAYGDDSVKIPFPVATWTRGSGEAEKQLLQTLKDHNASALVVGLPLGPSGERTAMCERVESFVRRIERRCSIPIVFVDEAFSSVEATESLPKNHATAIDAFAACKILQNYFDSI
jgi:putative Holliday junction resolvase